MLAAAEPIGRTEIEALRRYAPFDRMDAAAFEYLALHVVAATHETGTTT